MGSKLIELDDAGNLTVVGSMNTSSGPLSMAAGFNYLMIVDGTDGWHYDGTTFAKITDADFPTADYVTWVDQYFVVNSSGTGKFYISALGDPTSWSAADFSTAEKRADDLLRPVEFRGDLLLIGEHTSELWQNSGNTDFPWQVYPNAIIELGTHSPSSVAFEGSSMFMLASTREGGSVVIQANSETPVPISDKDIEWRISQIEHTDAEGFCYRQNGHAFYQLTFPTAKVTYVYDITEKVWHERSNKTRGRHLAGGHVFFNNRHFVGEFAEADIYEFDENTYTDNKEAIVRLLRSAPIINSQKLIGHSRLELILAGGVANSDATNPQVSLRWSDDGGYSWSNEHFKSMGEVGEYGRRVRWFQLGSSRERIYEVRCSDPVNFVLIDAFLDIESGVD
jgi:hypothetical protein